MAAPARSTAVSNALEVLASRVNALQVASKVLRTSIVEDFPTTSTGRSDHKALQDLAEAADDFDDAVSAAEESLAGATARRRDVTSVAVVRALLVAEHVLRDELVPVGGRFDLARRVAEGWGPHWRAWAQVVRAGVLDVGEALSATEESAADVIAALLDSRPTHDYEEVVP
jgi:hypothetical protein